MRKFATSHGTRRTGGFFQPGPCAVANSAGISCSTSVPRISGGPGDMMEIAARYRSSPTFVRYSAIEDAETIRKEWDDFIEKETGDVFFTYDWCRVWWRHYGNRRNRSSMCSATAGDLRHPPDVRERIRLGPVSTTVVKLMCPISRRSPCRFPCEGTAEKRRVVGPG